MAFSSVSVVTNSLLLRRFESGKESRESTSRRVGRRAVADN